MSVSEVPASKDPTTIPSPEWLDALSLPDGTVVRFRHVRPEDEPLIAAAINSASRETLLHRFFSPIRSVSPEMLRRMLVLDPTQETCVVGLIESANTRRLVCGARYVKLARPGTAEIAITVHDDFQHRGLGTLLLRLLAKLAARDRLHIFEAEVLSSNLKMLTLLRKLTDGQFQSMWTGDVYHMEFSIQPLLK